MASSSGKPIVILTRLQVQNAGGQNSNYADRVTQVSRAVPWVRGVTNESSLLFASQDSYVPSDFTSPSFELTLMLSTDNVTFEEHSYSGLVTDTISETITLSGRVVTVAGTLGAATLTIDSGTLYARGTITVKDGDETYNITHTNEEGIIQYTVDVVATPPSANLTSVDTTFDGGDLVINAAGSTGTHIRYLLRRAGVDIFDTGYLAISGNLNHTETPFTCQGGDEIFVYVANSVSGSQATHVSWIIPKVSAQLQSTHLQNNTEHVILYTIEKDPNTPDADIVADWDGLHTDSFSSPSQLLTRSAIPGASVGSMTHIDVTISDSIGDGEPDIINLFIFTSSYNPATAPAFTYDGTLTFLPNLAPYNSQFNRYQIEWGDVDGTVEDFSTNPLATNFEYQSGGNKTLTIFCTNDDGNTVSVTQSVTINQANVDPTGLSISGITQTAAFADWDDVICDGYVYNIDGGTDVDVASISEAELTGLAPGTSYTFNVRSYIGPPGNRTYSNPASAIFSTTAAGTIQYLERIPTNQGNTNSFEEPDGVNITDSPWSMQRTIQTSGASVAGVADFEINGGTYPDHSFISELAPVVGSRFESLGHPDLLAGIMIPYHVPGSGVVFADDVSSWSPSNPLVGGTVAYPGNLGPYRNHMSFMQRITMPGQWRSSKYRDQTDPNLGRRNGVAYAGFFSNQQYHYEAGNLNAFLEPVSTGATKLDGTPVENIAYMAFSIMFVSDSETIDYYWPGQDQGNYGSQSTDGPHFAFNIRQGKGRQSGVVTWNFKWRGQQVILIRQDRNNSVVTPSGGVVIIGPNATTANFQNNLSTYANQHIDFLVRVQAGRDDIAADNSGMVVWMKLSSENTWTEVHRDSYDMLSELENITNFPYYYFGMPDNFGIYPSGNRLDNWAMTNQWNPWTEANGRTGYVKIRHTPSYVANFAEVNDPGEAAMQADALSLFSL